MESTDSWRGPIQRLDAPMSRFQTEWNNIQSQCPESLRKQLKLTSAQNPTRNLKVLNADDAKWTERDWINAQSSYYSFYEPFENIESIAWNGAGLACQSAVRNAADSLRAGHEILWRVDSGSAPRGAMTPQLGASPRDDDSITDPYDAETRDLVKDVERARVQMTDIYCGRSDGKKFENKLGQIQGSPVLHSPLGDNAFGSDAQQNLQRVARAENGLRVISADDHPRGDCGLGFQHLETALGNLRQHLQKSADPAYRKQVAQARAQAPENCTTFMVDASSSMKKKFGDKTRAEHLNGLFTDYLGRHPNGAAGSESIMAFGLQGIRPGYGDCAQVGPLDPAGQSSSSRDEIVGQVGQIQFLGSTPMTLATLLGEGRYTRCKNRRVILVTDGGKGGSDGCRKDFCEAIRKLQNAGIQIELDFIHYREINEGDPLKQQMDCVKQVQAGTGVSSRLISGNDPAAIEDVFGHLVNAERPADLQVNAQLAHPLSVLALPLGSAKLVTSNPHYRNTEGRDPAAPPVESAPIATTRTDAKIVPADQNAQLDQMFADTAAPAAAPAAADTSADTSRNLASGTPAAAAEDTAENATQPLQSSDHPATAVAANSDFLEDPVTANQTFRALMPRYEEFEKSAKPSAADLANEDVAAKTRQSMAPGLYEGDYEDSQRRKHSCVVVVKQQGPWYFSKTQIPMVDISVYDQDDLVKRKDGKLAFKNGEYVQVSFGQRGGWTAQGLANEYTPAKLREVATDAQHPFAMPALHATGDFSQLQTSPGGARGSFTLDVNGFYYRTADRRGRYLRDSRTIAIDFAAQEKLQLASRRTSIAASVDRGELQKITVTNKTGAADSNGASGRESLDKAKTCDHLQLKQRFADAPAQSQNQNVDDSLNHQSN